MVIIGCGEDFVHTSEPVESFASQRETFVVLENYDLCASGVGGMGDIAVVVEDYGRNGPGFDVFLACISWDLQNTSDQYSNSMNQSTYI